MSSPSVQVSSTPEHMYSLLTEAQAKLSEFTKEYTKKNPLVAPKKEEQKEEENKLSLLLEDIFHILDNAYDLSEPLDDAQDACSRIKEWSIMIKNVLPIDEHKIIQFQCANCTCKFPECTLTMDPLVSLGEVCKEMEDWNVDDHDWNKFYYKLGKWKSTIYDSLKKINKCAHEITCDCCDHKNRFTVDDIYKECGYVDSLLTTKKAYLIPLLYSMQKVIENR